MRVVDADQLHVGVPRLAIGPQQVLRADFVPPALLRRSCIFQPDRKRHHFDVVIDPADHCTAALIGYEATAWLTISPHGPCSILIICLSLLVPEWLAQTFVGRIAKDRDDCRFPDSAGNHFFSQFSIQPPYGVISC